MIKAIIVGVVVLSILLFAGSLIAMIFWTIGRHMLWMMGITPFGWRFMFLVSLFFLALLAFGLYSVFKGLPRRRRFLINEREDALEILKRRYAKGELTYEQYLKMKEELK